MRGNCQPSSFFFEILGILYNFFIPATLIFKIFTIDFHRIVLAFLWKAYYNEMIILLAEWIHLRMFKTYFRIYLHVDVMMKP